MKVIILALLMLSPLICHAPSQVTVISVGNECQEGGPRKVSLIVRLRGLTEKQRERIKKRTGQKPGQFQWVYGCGVYHDLADFKKALVGLRRTLQRQAKGPVSLSFSLRVSCNLTARPVLDTVGHLLTLAPLRVEILDAR